MTNLAFQKTTYKLVFKKNVFTFPSSASQDSVEENFGKMLEYPLSHVRFPPSGTAANKAATCIKEKTHKQQARSRHAVGSAGRVPWSECLARLGDQSKST